MAPSLSGAAACPTSVSTKHVPEVLPQTLVGWFDDFMHSIEDDMQVEEFFDSTDCKGELSLLQKSQIFDALFTPEVESGHEDLGAPHFRENWVQNQIEWEIPTCFGDFFHPEDVEVTVRGHEVELTASKQEKSSDGNSSWLRQVKRTFNLPKTANPRMVRVEMAPTGKLMFSAPLLKPFYISDDKEYSVFNREREREPGATMPLRVNYG